MKKLSQQLTYWLGVVAIGLVVGLSLQFVQAWTEPSGPAPTGNVGAPLNTSGIGQGKSGGLILNTGGAVTGLIVQNGSVGVGALTPSVGGEQDLKFDVEGAVGAQWYCDQDGNNCVAGNDLDGGGAVGYNFITFPSSDRAKILKDGATIDLNCTFGGGDTPSLWGWVRNNGGVIETKVKAFQAGGWFTPEKLCETDWAAGYHSECNSDGVKAYLDVNYMDATLQDYYPYPLCYGKGYWGGERTQWQNL